MPREFVLYLAVLTIRSLALMATAGILTMLVRNVAVRHAVWAMPVSNFSQVLIIVSR